MKKVIIASLVFLLIGSAAIYADSVSLVGRKVQSEAVVTLDGEEIGSVLIIDGVSYAPVRTIAEASGLKAGYKKGEVMLSSIKETISTTTSDAIDSASLIKERNRLKIEADTLRNYIKDANHVIAFHTEALKTVDETLIDTYEESLNKSKKDKEGFENTLRDVEMRITEIDALLN